MMPLVPTEMRWTRSCLSVSESGSVELGPSERRKGGARGEGGGRGRRRLQRRVPKQRG